MQSYNLRTSSLATVLGALALSLAPACSDASDQTQIDEPVAELQASPATQAELEVLSWAVFDSGEESSLRIVGLDASSARRVELQVERPAGDDVELDLQVSFPELG